MIRSDLRAVFRRLLKNKAYAFTTIGGLAVGLSAFLVILVYVNHETGYDDWDPQLRNVYRIGFSEVKNGEEHKYVRGLSVPAAIMLREACPEISAITQVFVTGEQLVKGNGKSFYEKKIISADSSFLRVFPYRLRNGRPSDALSGPGKVILSLVMSRKIFGNDTPLGKTLEIVYTDTRKTYLVTGVFEKDGPSHLDFDLCTSAGSQDLSSWTRTNYLAYTRINPSANIPKLSKRADRVFAKSAYFRDRQFNNQSIHPDGKANGLDRWLKTEKIAGLHMLLEPVRSIHLDPWILDWRGPVSWTPIFDYASGNRTPVLAFAAAGILILVLACINYTNLAIAEGGKRAREAGIRKVLGSGRRKLVMQFLVEALVQCTLAVLLALLLAAVLLPRLNETLGLRLTLWSGADPLANTRLIVQLSLVILATTLIAGLYPAFYLSRFKPVAVMRGDGWRGAHGKLFRNVLIVAQFAISSVFVAGLTVMYRQVDYMTTNDPGFDTEKVMSVTVNDGSLITPGRPGERTSYIRNSLAAIPGVSAVAISDVYPGEPAHGAQLATMGTDTATLTFNPVDISYFRLFNMKIREGRGFSSIYALDTVDAAVLNEAAVRKLGIKNPVGKVVNILLRDYRVIGVLEDNLNDGYGTAVQPSLYAVGSQEGMLAYGKVLIRIDEKSVSATLAAVSRFWTTLEPEFPMRYEWVTESYSRLMERPRILARLTMIAALVAMLLALTGIIALTALIAGERRKEIGIRKVFGASVTTVVAMLTTDFARLVAISITIAIPLSWWLTSIWLDNFVYRAAFAWWIYPLVAGTVLLPAVITVSLRSLGAATTSPVKSLRNEQ